ncbi:MAG: sigma-70 family RNA polymerase sigma factor [Saprospiraceae bacterium]|nr:sigma-70 family RNA polymerase sigma factor [Saprospiraceae bacterium]
MENGILIPHLFRTEFGKITVVLTRYLGMDHLDIAEDLSMETFTKALEHWPHQGVPENPRAWLYAVAKNQALNWLKRQQNQRHILHSLNIREQCQLPEEINLSDDYIQDSQLRMLFAICHPSIGTLDQVSLALRILCGFGIDEIANALLASREAVNKRLFRAKQNLRSSAGQLEYPGQHERRARMGSVLTTLYLLFNEGYYSESEDCIMREDLAMEAIRLCYLLITNPETNLPETNALLALMCFHASRFPARKDQNGHFILYHLQNESLWNQELITQGMYFLNQAAQGDRLTRYHLEASIAYWHTQKEDTQLKWENILQLYNHLLTLHYSPIAALNRTYAVAKVYGNATGRMEAEKLGLTNNPYYCSLLASLYADDQPERSLQLLDQAILLSGTDPERRLLQERRHSLLKHLVED